MILAGDIGGTKSLLALYPLDGDPRYPLAEKSFPSRDYAGLGAVVDAFLQSAASPVRYACFGLPGPVVNGRCEAPNLPWVVEATEIERILRTEVALLNDLEVTGHGIPVLEPEELEILSRGEPERQGNAALIAPGTGLGECILFWDGQAHRPSASEGGHSDFAPRTLDQLRFLEWALRNYRPRVSYDRVASGNGLPLVYRYLEGTGVAEESKETAREIREAEDVSAAISRLALERRSLLCEKTLDLWVSVLGAEAGNLALKALAVAGLYLGGGIPPKILPKLKEGTFLEAFRDKGRLQPLMEQIPVRVILNDRAALLGAAQYALARARKRSVRT